MQVVQSVFAAFLAFVIGAHCGNLDIFDSSNNDNTTRTEGRCAKKCGIDPGIKCEGAQTSDETTICGCVEEIDVYDEENKICIERCTKKCGSEGDIKCSGNQTTEETTICGCVRETDVYDESINYCVSRCFIKCGSFLTCDGDQRTYETTICRCSWFEQLYDEKNGTCKERCNIKCGDDPYIECDGFQMTDEDTICGCNRKNRVYDPVSKMCLRRCVKKCGSHPSIKCEGDQMTDDTTICRCREENMVYDGESRKCRIFQSQCDCKNGFCKEIEEGKSVCKCPPEYGLFTETECRKCDCGKGANCTWNDVGTTQKKCICREGYSDSGGTCKGDCSNIVCMNGGTCRVVRDDNACVCAPPFFGDRCEKNRCKIKCGIDPSIKCKGDQMTDETTICGCPDETRIYNHGYCEDRCKVKCGEASCDGDMKTDGTTICICPKKTEIFNKEHKLCEERCMYKCGWDDLTVQCTGDQTTFETTICGCKDITRFYDVESRKCTDPCSPNPCQNDESCSRNGMTFKCDNLIQQQQSIDDRFLMTVLLPVMVIGTLVCLVSAIIYVCLRA